MNDNWIENQLAKRRDVEVIAWRVTADGDTIGTFDNWVDAVGMADAWNTAYPHDPWFKVVEDLAAPPSPQNTKEADQ